MEELKKFKKFINESELFDSYLTVKEFLKTPQELEDIFEICKNEIYLSNNDISIVELYSKIFFDCLMQYNELTLGYVDMISSVRENITKSSNEREVRFQYKKITNPKHIFSAELLKILTDYKNIEFDDDKLKKYEIINTLVGLVKASLTLTHGFRTKLLKSKIKVK